MKRIILAAGMVLILITIALQNTPIVSGNNSTDKAEESPLFTIRLKSGKSLFHKEDIKFSYLKSRVSILSSLIWKIRWIKLSGSENINYRLFYKPYTAPTGCMTPTLCPVMPTLCSFIPTRCRCI